MRLCIDLAALRGAGRQGAVGAIEPAPAWSEDGRVAALCTLDPAAPAPNGRPSATRIAQRWLESWERAPGTWPDLDCVAGPGVIIDLDRMVRYSRPSPPGRTYALLVRDGACSGSRVSGRNVLRGHRRPEIDPAVLSPTVLSHVPTISALSRAPSCRGHSWRKRRPPPRCSAIGPRPSTHGRRRIALRVDDRTLDAAVSIDGGEPRAARSERGLDRSTSRLRRAIGTSCPCFSSDSGRGLEG